MRKKKRNTRRVYLLSLQLSPSTALQTISNQPVLGVYNYVQVETEQRIPLAGVGVVHQALAAPHTTRGVLRFTVCVTDGCEVAGEWPPLAQ